MKAAEASLVEHICDQDYLISIRVNSLDAIKAACNYYTFPDSYLTLGSLSSFGLDEGMCKLLDPRSRMICSETNDQKDENERQDDRGVVVRHGYCLRTAFLGNSVSGRNLVGVV